MIYFDSYTLWLIVTPWRLVTEPWRHESPCGCCGCSSALAPKMRSRAAWWKMVKSSAILRNPEESSGDNHDIPWLIWTITLGLLYLYWCELMWIDVNIWESKIQKIQDSHFWNLGSKVSKSPPSHNRKSEQQTRSILLISFRNLIKTKCCYIFGIMAWWPLLFILFAPIAPFRLLSQVHCWHLIFSMRLSDVEFGS